ncbi:hypothetical protein D9613_009002 [Agrocybe pediades]|uniref:GH16 domain-containing protein n=1 Tax=Agrocybe pediades TaxID=84607 RepID=A0A8H4VTX5_9AGAR|nr:hypothetical protein D9613_009002 [Agrocybe pediades]KAF9558452.1 glycoside hydrolase family 16 protein [Agrocybe pediades]
MKFSTTFFGASLVHLAVGTLTSTYYLKENVVGRDFYSHFDWQAIKDPTHGRVTYVDEPTARGLNLTYASHDTFILRTDATTVLDPAGPGRNSVRITTKNTYTTHVAIFDVRHMPQGCGTWPAIWATTETDWPSGGEIDIVEGVNDMGPNAGTLHTVEGCTMPASRPQSGISGQLDCNWLVNYNTGCTVKFKSNKSYGPEFNSNRGGWFVMERTEQHISMWFWARDDHRVPLEIKLGLPLLNTKTWGLPAAYFPNTECDLEKFFKAHKIIINLTLCGDWAGETNTWAASGCPSTCVDYVNNNPTAFADAYFDFAAMRIYQPIF